MSKFRFVSIWIRNLISLQMAYSLLSAFGVLWLCAEIIEFFSEPFAEKIRNGWIFFFLSGFLYAGWKCRPKNKILCRLVNRDVIIELTIGDVFDFPGALIAGSNTTFDTEVSRDLISERSVQGQFTKRYYDGARQLDTELEAALKGYKHETLQGNRVGKTRRYEIGTVAKLMPRGKTAYYTAIAHINEHGSAYGDFEEVKEALAKLWVFISDRGAKEELVMPVIGTGFTRLKTTREDVIREIIRSFIAACSEKVFCDKLTIVISPNDAQKHSIELKNLGAFLQHLCEYTEFSPTRERKPGQGIS